MRKICYNCTNYIDHEQMWEDFDYKAHGRDGMCGIQKMAISGEHVLVSRHGRCLRHTGYKHSIMQAWGRAQMIASANTTPLGRKGGIIDTIINGRKK